MNTPTRSHSLTHFTLFTPFTSSMRQEVLVGEDAVEGRAADLSWRAERSLLPRLRSSTYCTWRRMTASRDRLAAWTVVCGPRLVSKPLAAKPAPSPMAGPRGEYAPDCRLTKGCGNGCGPSGRDEVEGADDAVIGFEQGILKGAEEFAHVARPRVLQKAGERAGPKHNGALLIADAEPAEEELCERGDVFAALAQRRNGEANGGEAEREIG